MNTVSYAWYDLFIEKLYEKYPKKSHLMQALMDLLYLEREAVYRRLRKDVMLHADEIVKIASAWNISLDEIMNINSGNVFFQMHPLNYLDPSEQEIKDLRSRIEKLRYVRTSDNSEYMEVCNKLSGSLITRFQNLYRFEIFKWAYQYTDERTHTPLSQTIISNEIIKETEEYHWSIKNIKKTDMIWDKWMFDYFVRNVLYFHSIRLVTDEEKELIKKDLLALLDYLFEVATNGSYPETRNKVDIFISQLNIDTNYSYIYADKLKICRIRAFGRYDIYAKDPELVDNFKTWMLLKKRTSVQISEVDEKSRIEFFMKQRQIVEEL